MAALEASRSAVQGSILNARIKILVAPAGSAEPEEADDRVPEAGEPAVALNQLATSKLAREDPRQPGDE